MTSAGSLTIDLAGQRRVLQQSDVLTFGRAADMVVDEDNPYMHRIVGRFFFHGGSWWLENLGSFIELEVVPEGATSLRLPPSEPESTPVVHALAPPSFSVRFESNGTTYELAGLVDQVQASLAGAGQMPHTSNGSSAPAGVNGLADSSEQAPFQGVPSEPLPSDSPLPGAPSNGNYPPPADPLGDLAPVPSPGALGEQAFAPPPDPSIVAEPAPLVSPFADFGSVPPPGAASDAFAPPPAQVAPSPMPGAPASPEASSFVLAREEYEVLTALAEPWLREPALAGAQPLPSDADLAARLGRPTAQVTMTIVYLCNRLTRAGVRGLQGGGDRRGALVRHALDTHLIG